MIVDNILKAKFSYSEKYEVEADVLFLSHKSYAALMMQVPDASILREQKIFDLQIIRLNGNGLGDYFSVRSSESLKHSRTWLERYRIPLIPNPDAVAKPRPDFDDVVVEEIPQFEIDAYMDFLQQQKKQAPAG